MNKAQEKFVEEDEWTVLPENYHDYVFYGDDGFIPSGRYGRKVQDFPDIIVTYLDYVTYNTGQDLSWEEIDDIVGFFVNDHEALWEHLWDIVKLCEANMFETSSDGISGEDLRDFLELMDS